MTRDCGLLPDLGNVGTDSIPFGVRPKGRAQAETLAIFPIITDRHRHPLLAINADSPILRRMRCGEWSGPPLSRSLPNESGNAGETNRPPGQVRNRFERAGSSKRCVARVRFSVPFCAEVPQTLPVQPDDGLFSCSLSRNSHRMRLAADGCRSHAGPYPPLSLRLSHRCRHRHKPHQPRSSRDLRHPAGNLC